MTKRMIVLYAAVMFGTVAALLWQPRNVEAAPATSYDACVVTVTTTSTLLSSLAVTAGCDMQASACVMAKNLDASVGVCTGGLSGSTGNPASLAAGNKCFPLSAGDTYPTAVPTTKMHMRVQAGTVLVSLAAVNGC